MPVFVHFKELFLYFIAIFAYAESMSNEEIQSLRDDARELFYHGYNGYMKNAYPADELMPLSCKGRYRGSEANRGDIDDALGNFSLTLVDTLDSLIVFNNLTEFENAVFLVNRDLSFDTDVVVSVFETNIRVLGGLLSAHVLADYVKAKFNRMDWYHAQLLNLAKDLGNRLLPAFNTTTGIPHPRINLKHGTTNMESAAKDTCTACAGTMILEFGALSRLTGDPIYEVKARNAMDYLWQGRNRASDLVGTVLNIHNGDWVRRESGVGAGIDSYYEYLMKAYILLGDETYLRRFNKHYNGIMKYISQGPLLVDVHMHRPTSNSKHFMDSLLAFWPGLQVLKGDIKPAIETHEILYQVMQRHNFLMPEAFTVSDFNVYWGQHLLRPEFLESTYFLYKATNDHHYLEVGKQVMSSMKKFALASCGFAAVKDVRTGLQDDRMDSFVLAETLKYLYLLFASDSDLIINLDDFIFTTEAHLLPLTLSMQVPNGTIFPYFPSTYISNLETDHFRSCPNTLSLFSSESLALIREGLKDIIPSSSISSSSTSSETKSCSALPSELKKPRLSPRQFSASNKEHLNLVQEMGISVVMMPDSRIQLVHSSTSAVSQEAAEEGTSFMQEMIDISREQVAKAESQLRIVSFVSPKTDVEIRLNAGLAQFGKDLLKSGSSVTSRGVLVQPSTACHLPITIKGSDSSSIRNKIAIVSRGDCMFIQKARNVEKLGAIACIVLDNVPDTSSDNLPLFAMSGDGNDDVNIPALFLYSKEAAILVDLLKEYDDMLVSLSSNKHGNEEILEKREDNENSGSASVTDVSQDVIKEEIKHLEDLMDLLNMKIRSNERLRDKLSDERVKKLVKSFLKTSLKSFTRNYKKYISPALFEEALNGINVNELISKLILGHSEFQDEHQSSNCINPAINSEESLHFLLSSWTCERSGPGL